MFPIAFWSGTRTQVEETKKFHGIPGNRIQVTGAQGFDDWFAMAPSTSREEFCDALSFNPDDQFSSMFARPSSSATWLPRSLRRRLSSPFSRGGFRL